MHPSRLSRNLITILLLSTAITMMPVASSQPFTTSTSFLTSSIIGATTYQAGTLTVITTGATTFATTAYLWDMMGGPPCYFAILGRFNSTGMTYIDYSVNTPINLYIVNYRAWSYWQTTILSVGVNPSTCQATSQETLGLIDQTVLQGSGSLHLNLISGPPVFGVVLTAPMQGTSPIAALTIGPVLYLQTVTETVSIRLRLTTTGATTLMTFLSTVQVPFMETYGNWILSATVGTLVIVGLVFFDMRLLRRTKKQSRKRRRHRK